MTKPLQDATRNIFGQLVNLLENIHPAEYQQPLGILSENSVGKHVRHIIEFYELFIESLDTGRLNYDSRKHEKPLEQDPEIARKRVLQVTEAIMRVQTDKSLLLEASLGPSVAKNLVACQTNFHRELLFNLEHAVHHMAIIKIAVREMFTRITLPESFGIASSTVRYQKAHAAAESRPNSSQENDNPDRISPGRSS